LRCFRQARPAFAHRRKNETLAQLSAGFGPSEATAWRYVGEAVDVLAAWALGLHAALTGRGARTIPCSGTALSDPHRPVE
jgi:hypothetical protein